MYIPILKWQRYCKMWETQNIQLDNVAVFRTVMLSLNDGNGYLLE